MTISVKQLTLLLPTLGAGYSDKMVQNFDDKFGPLLGGDDIANAIHYIVTQPPHVHISDIIVRPTREDYP